MSKLNVFFDSDEDNVKNGSLSSTEIIQIEDDENDRYSRLKLIPWWDQKKLRNAKVMVVGAGALGNEILKNLALLGVGSIYIVDLDEIENSNLSRSVLYRARDEGKYKAKTAAVAIRDINPDCQVRWIKGNIAYDVGLGLFRSMDVVIGGLDNREARLAINQACWKVGTPWIDGAIEVFFGTARVFVPPTTACYECTMNEQDYKLLNQRRSCALLSRSDMLLGKIPTTPTISSIIAGIQVQEAIKLIHARDDLPTLAGKGYFFNGLTYDSYIIEYDRKESCPSHETFKEIIELKSNKTEETTLKEMVQIVRQHMGPEALLELDKEVITTLRCEKCNSDQEMFKILGQVSENEARCKNCGEIRTPNMTHTINGSEPYLNITLTQLGLPLLDIVTGRVGLKMKHFELTGDLLKLDSLIQE